MKRHLLVLSVCLAFLAGGAWAGVIGTTNPADFAGGDPVNWCQFGCPGVHMATPQPWASGGGTTGLVGLNGLGEDFWVRQQDVNWAGNFATGMGLIFNGAATGFGNSPASIAVTFDNPIYGVGAFIQADFFGAFTGTMTLYDYLYQPLGTFSANGLSEYNPGTALFLGAYSSDLIYAVEFSAIGVGPTEPDFAIGTMLTIPEPATFVLMVPALVGLAAWKRRRGIRKSTEGK